MDTPPLMKVHNFAFDFLILRNNLWKIATGDVRGFGSFDIGSTRQ